MPIFNRIIKKVTCSSSSGKQMAYTLDKADAIQKKILKQFVRRAKFTAFGEHYRFSFMIDSGNLPVSFKKTVPIHSYDDMYVRWWYRSLNGETYVTWPGKIKYFITKHRSKQITGKKIPVSRAMMSSYLTIGVKYLSFINNKRITKPDKDELKLDFYNTYYGGTLTAILAHHKPAKFYFCLGDVFTGKISERGKGYLLTEVGLIGIRSSESEQGYKLVVDNGIYYEFYTQAEELVAEQEEFLKKDGATLSLNQVEDNTNYGLILTNNSGAWRYFTGYIISFTDKEKLMFKVFTKVKINS